MDITIKPKKLEGTISAIPSKSQAHRFLICAAFSDGPTTIHCPQINEDMEATAACLNALGASVVITAKGFNVQPITKVPAKAILPCRESGSTLRFMLPIVGALGVEGTFCMEGRLSQRPLSPLREEMERMGCQLSRPTKNSLLCTGALRGGNYAIDGGVSSQFITGLLFALSILPAKSALNIIGKLESAPYVTMTYEALRAFGVTPQNHLGGAFPFHSHGTLTVEGDWSNAAFFLCAKKLGNDLTVTSLNPSSAQGDKAVSAILSSIKTASTVDCMDSPDLVPILAVTAAAHNGAVFQGIARLRLKESDRVASVIEMLHAFGIPAHATEHSLTVHPGSFGGCTVDSAGDHRIAMAAAIGATAAGGPVTILGADCVKKSYPTFWDEYKRLGGTYEQHIR